MKLFKYNFILFIYIYSLSRVHANYIKKVACFFYECCDKPYLQRDFNLLEQNLNKYLFGQPLVTNTTVNALKAHYNLKNPNKALVLSFHGVTGSGKNYVSKFIAESLYEKGTESRFYTFFSSTKDFLINSKVDQYKEAIISSVRKAVRMCEYSLFVFDEMDKIPIGLIDAIKPFIEHGAVIDGYDFRKSVFIFLSNSASKDIAERTLFLDSQNIQRENFEMKTFQKVIYDHVYNAKGNDGKGMWHCGLISSHLIDYYVPFLPLERKHIKMCINTEFEKHGINANTHVEYGSYVDHIADEMVYEPPGTHKYAASGCKRVVNLVRKFITEKKLKSTQVKTEF